MKKIRWEGQIEDARIALKNQGLNCREIADTLSYMFNYNITKDMVYGREKTLKKKLNLQNTNIVSENIKQNVISNQLFDDELYNTKDKYILSEQTKIKMKEIWELFNTSGSKKIFNISDLHAPYINFEKLEIAIKDNLDCDICVLNGDIFDGESMSSFDKLNELNSSEEFKQVRQVLDILNDKFKYVVWIGGNHDFQRFYRYICKNIKSGLRQYAFDRLNPIKYLSEGYDNVITIDHNTIEIGDVVFKHPNGYSNVEMKTVINENDILYANRYDLPNPNFRAVIIGHTHYAGEYIKNGVKLMETGCMCYMPDYRFTNPVKKRWVTAYARIELDNNNNIIFNKSHLVYLDD